MTVAVAEVVNRYLPLTQTFLYATLSSLTRVRPFVLTAETENLEAFPFEDLVVVDRSGWLSARLDGLVRRASGRRPALERRYAAALRQTDARLLHGHFGWSAPTTLPLKRDTGIPLITTFYGVDMSALPRMAEWQRIYTELFDQGDLFLVEGSHMARCLAGIGCPSDRIAVHHIGINTEAIDFAPRTPASGGETRLLMCGAFREKKGIRYGIEAFAQIARDRDGVRLIIAGDGPDRPVLEDLIEELGMGERIDMVGFVDHKRFHQLAQDAHLFLAPSCTAADGDSEGGAPTVLLEAQASGLPVISTLHADIPEVVRDGVSGVLVPERDVDSLAEAISTLLGHPEAWAGMGEAGRAHVRAEYEIRELARDLEDRYLALAN